MDDSKTEVPKLPEFDGESVIVFEWADVVERALRTVEYHLIECSGPWLKGVPSVDTKKEISLYFSFQKAAIRRIIECLTKGACSFANMMVDGVLEVGVKVARRDLWMSRLVSERSKVSTILAQHDYEFPKVISWINVIQEIKNAFVRSSLIVLDRRMSTVWPSMARRDLFIEALKFAALPEVGDTKVFRTLAAMLSSSDKDLVSNTLSLVNKAVTTSDLVEAICKLDAVKEQISGVLVGGWPLGRNSSSEALTVSVATTSTPRSYHKKFECYYCGKVGHSYAKCFKMTRDREAGLPVDKMLSERMPESRKAKLSSKPYGESKMEGKPRSVVALASELSVDPARWFDDDDGPKHISTLTRGRKGLIYIAVDVDGQKIPMLIDSGAVCNVASLDFARHLGAVIHEDRNKEEVIQFGNGQEERSLGRIELTLRFGRDYAITSFLVFRGLAHNVILGAAFMESAGALICFKERVVRIRNSVVKFVEKEDAISFGTVATMVEPLKEDEVSFRPPPVVLASSNSMSKEEEEAMWNKMIELKSFCGTEEQRSRLRSLLMKFRRLFTCTLAQAGCAKFEPARISVEEDASPKWAGHRRLSDAEHELMDEEVAKLLASGAIREVREESTSRGWNSGVTFVKKSDGTMRMCVDFRALNAVTKKNCSPLPIPDELLRRAMGFTFLSKLDIISAYHQVPLKESDRHFTAFNTRKGRYEWNVIPFGLTNAPAHFQTRMNFFLEGLNDVAGFMDDMLAGSVGFEDHYNALEALFTKASEFNLKFNLKKCVFGVREIEFLGFEVTNGGTRPLREKVQFILDMPRPVNSDEVRSFAGMVEYYNGNVKGVAHLLTPLRRVMTGHFEWKEEQEIAWKELKRRLAELPTLFSFDSSAETEIHTDASTVGLGAVLVQRKDGVERVIRFWSRALRSAEVNYDPTKLELLAVHDALVKFRPFIFGRHVTVFTDHKPLIGLLRSGKPDSASVMIRWILRIGEFDITVKHRPGASNANADALSRFPVCSVILSKVVSFAKAQRQEAFGAELLKAALKGDRKDVVLKDEVIFIVDRHGRELIFVPEVLRKNVLEEGHNGEYGGHFGPHKTFRSIQALYWWPTVEKDVAAFCNMCTTCVQKRKDRMEHGIPSNIPFGEPWMCVAVDSVGPLPLTDDGNQFILVAIDAFTKNVEVKAVPSNSAVEYLKFLLEDVVARHGVPSNILADNGTNYVASAVKELYKSFGILEKHSTPYNPQGNGLVERFNRTMNMLLRLACNGDLSAQWDIKLAACVFAYRKTVHSATGFSPFFLEHGREVATPLKALMAVDASNIVDHHDYIETLKKALAGAKKEAEDSIRSQQAKRNETLTVAQPPTRFRVNDLVWVHEDQTSGSKKLYWSWRGPFKVLHKYSDQVYKVGDLRSGLVVDKINIRRLRLAAQVLDSKLETSFPESVHIGESPVVYSANKERVVDDIVEEDDRAMEVEVNELDEAVNVGVEPMMEDTASGGVVPQAAPSTFSAPALPRENKRSDEGRLAEFKKTALGVRGLKSQKKTAKLVAPLLRSEKMKDFLGFFTTDALKAVDNQETFERFVEGLQESDLREHM